MRLGASEALPQQHRHLPFGPNRELKQEETNQDPTKKDDAERRRANKLSTKTKHKQAAAAAIIIAVVVNWRSPSSPVKRVPAELVDTRISKVNA